MEQLDELGVTDGVVAFVRHTPTIMVQFDSSGDTVTSDMLPVDQFFDGWMATFPVSITAERIALARNAVAELMLAFAGPEI